MDQHESLQEPLTRLKTILCEWSKRVEDGLEPDNYLEGVRIYERLVTKESRFPTTP